MYKRLEQYIVIFYIMELRPTLFIYNLVLVSHICEQSCKQLPLKVSQNQFPVNLCHRNSVIDPSDLDPVTVDPGPADRSSSVRSHKAPWR